MTPMFVQLVERGDGEDGVSMPGRRTEGLPRSKPVTYAADPERDLSPTPLTPLGAVAGVDDRLRLLSLA